MRKARKTVAPTIDYSNHMRGRWRAQVREGRTGTAGDLKEGAPYLPGRCGLWAVNLSAAPLYIHHSAWHPLDQWTELAAGEFLILEDRNLWTEAPMIRGTRAGQQYRIGQWLPAFDEPPSVIEGRATEALSVLFAAKPDRKALTIESRSDGVLVLFEAHKADPVTVVQPRALWQAQPGAIPTGDLLIRTPLFAGADFAASEG